MTNDAFDRSSWERRWAQVLEQTPEKVASRPPSRYLLGEIGDARPGNAMDAGWDPGPRRSGWPPAGGR